MIGAFRQLRLDCLPPCLQSCAHVHCHADIFAVLLQACEAPQGGDYDKLRAHMQQASVKAYHQKAAMIDEHEAGLMQVFHRASSLCCACVHVHAHWPGCMVCCRLGRHLLTCKSMYLSCVQCCTAATLRKLRIDISCAWAKVWHSWLQAAQRFFVLTQTDNLWKEHLQAIKFLQQAVSLRGYAQVPGPDVKLQAYCNMSSSLH